MRVFSQFRALLPIDRSFRCVIFSSHLPVNYKEKSLNQLITNDVRFSFQNQDVRFSFQNQDLNLKHIVMIQCHLKYKYIIT